MATSEPAVHHGPELWFNLPAMGHPLRTPGREAATRRHRCRVRRLPVELLQAAGPLADPRDRVHEAKGVGVLRRGQNVPSRSLLDDSACVHDAHTVGHPFHDTDVVGDQDDGHLQLLGDLPEQVEKVGLHLGVERAGRLVRDEELRPAQERHRDHHPLALSAAQLIRVRLCNPIRLRDMDGGQVFPRLFVRRASAQAHLHGRSLRELVSDPEVRIERRPRVLEDHGRLGPAHRFHRLAVEIEQVDAVKRDLALDDPPRSRDQPKDRQAGSGLAGA